MTLATLLIIAFVPADPSYVVTIATPSHEECEVQMEAAFATWQRLYPDMEGYCRASAILWASPVPRERKE